MVMAMECWDKARHMSGVIQSKAHESKSVVMLRQSKAHERTRAARDAETKQGTRESRSSAWCWDKARHERVGTVLDAETIKAGTWESKSSVWCWDKARHMREQEEHDAETKQGTREQELVWARAAWCWDKESKDCNSQINSSRASL